jgi:serine/threonine protein kinase
MPMVVKIANKPLYSDVVEKEIRIYRMLAKFGPPRDLFATFFADGWAEGCRLFVIERLFYDVKSIHRPVHPSFTAQMAMDMVCYFIRISHSIMLSCYEISALSYLHKLGIVHNDIRPHNIFFRMGKTIKFTLIDFGYAIINTDDGQDESELREYGDIKFASLMAMQRKSTYANNITRHNPHQIHRSGKPRRL